MVKRCSAANCYNSQLTHKIGYFGYPKNDTVSREWARLAGRDDLVDKKLENLTKYFLCSDHFSSDAFVNPDCDDKSFLRLNKLHGVPLPSVFEDNLMKNVHTVTKNSDKFLNYSKHSIVEPSMRQPRPNIVRPSTTKVDVNSLIGKIKKIPPSAIEVRHTSNTTENEYFEIITQDEMDEEEFIEEDLEITRTDQDDTLNFSEFCRLCVTCPSDLIPIFDENGDFCKETECIKLMPHGTITCNDGLPQYACPECLHKLQSCMDTIDGFVKNQSLYSME